MRQCRRWLLVHGAELLIDSLRYVILMLVLLWLLAMAASVGL